MGYDTKLVIDDQGALKIDSLTALTSEDWGDWIRDQLQERMVVMISGEHEDDSTSVFSRHVPYLDPSERIKAYEGITQCLDGAYQERKDDSKRSQWNDHFLDSLLFLTGDIESRSERDGFNHQDDYFAQRSELITRFLEILEAKPSLSSSRKKIDLYGRTLQALCGTQSKLPLEFWNKQLELSPSVYGSVCFSGASYNSPYDGIAIISQVDWSERTKWTMHGSLLYFYHKHYGDKEVIEAIERKKLELPARAHEVFDLAKSGADRLVKG
ncbi:MAG: hypothetical protein WCV90_08250 [Candidatus Woesearchaeota archaeon]